MLILSTLKKIKPLFILTPSRIIKPSMSPYIRMFYVQPRLAPILNSRNNNFVVVKRTFFQIFRKPSAEKLKELDNMPPEYTLIYRNMMDRYLLSIQVFSTLSAILVCGLVLWSGQLSVEVNPQELKSDHPESFENEHLIYVTAFMTLYMFLYLMLTRMPVRIYNYPRRQKYVFVFYGALPTVRKHVVCQANEVIKVRESGLLPWRDSRYEILNKQRIIMLDNFFRKPSDLNIMLGYEKQSEDFD